MTRRDVLYGWFTAIDDMGVELERPGTGTSAGYCCNRDNSTGCSARARRDIALLSAYHLSVVFSGSLWSNKCSGTVELTPPGPRLQAENASSNPLRYRPSESAVLCMSDSCRGVQWKRTSCEPFAPIASSPTHSHHRHAHT